MADAPSRIQRSRAAGWRMPEGAVYVGRPTKWGNPWGVADCRRDGMAGTDAELAAWCVERFRQAVTNPLYRGGYNLDFDPRDIARLRGKTLACWCPLDQPCHADVLLELANAPLRCEAPAADA
jgi:hypothetical protein